MVRILAAALGILCTATAQGQSPVEAWGYTKDLYSIIRIRDVTTLHDNLVHNRLNVEWAPGQQWKLHGGVRTRLFVGDQAGNPFFIEALGRDVNDYLDLSLAGRIGEEVVIHTYFDRLYLEYVKDKWQFRLGRQRVNWGIHTTWNPNDLFNTFAFTDFDYEERPGSDVLSVKYYTGPVGSVEVVVQAFDRLDEATIAGIWRMNRWNYDFQWLGGVFRDHLVLGGGWAGQLDNWGFKGEFSTFTPFDPAGDFSATATMGWEYVFEGGLTLTFSGLYNSLGRTQGGLADLFDFSLSARNLYPFRWALLASSGIQIHPLVNGAMTLVYSPADSHPLFVNPFITWSVATNFDLDLVAQLTFNKQQDKYTSPVQGWFVRVKWSY